MKPDRPFVPLPCRLRLHRWRIPFNWTVRKGTCRCERCGKIKGPGATPPPNA